MRKEKYHIGAQPITRHGHYIMPDNRLMRLFTSYAILRMDPPDGCKGGFTMTERIDARGLSCPQPVVLTRNKMKELGKGIFEVIVETGTSRDNITRLAQYEGWGIKVKEEGDEFRIILSR